VRLLVGRGESRAELLEIARERTEVLIRHLLEPYLPGLGSLAGDKLVARASGFCAFWMMKPMRNLTIVVPMLVTSCHVSVQPLWDRAGPTR